MGLDAYVNRIKKVNLEDRVYTTEELRELGLSSVSKMYVDEDVNLYTDLLPYTIKRKVTVKRYNIEKIIEDYNLPKDSHIGMISSEMIVLYGEDETYNGRRQEVPRGEIERKYIKSETEMHYIWHEEEVAYWRKHYELQDWIYDALGNVDNTKYCILNTDTIREINRVFGECIPEEEPTDESALFYWEWY